MSDVSTWARGGSLCLASACQRASVGADAESRQVPAGLILTMAKSTC